MDLSLVAQKVAIALWVAMPYAPALVGRVALLLLWPG